MPARSRRWFALPGLLLALAACSEADEGLVFVPPLDAGPEADAAPPMVDDAEVDAEVDADPTVDRPYTATLDLPETPYAYAPELPAHFFVETLGFHGQRPAIQHDNTPPDNPTTDAGATLGRVLFYDTHLSLNRTVACASCHEQALGFSDDRVLSEGFAGGLTRRHSMGLSNARFYVGRSFFWDQRAATLEEQVLMPFQDEVEMGMTLDGLVRRVRDGAYYPPLFEAAFGDPEITADRISKALAQFVRSLVSHRSRYDEGRAMVEDRSQNFPNFDADENLGKFLFVMPPPAGGFGCFFCHQGEAFIAIEATSNGLDADVTADPGYAEVTGLATHQGTFKVPSLRNVAVRAPFMHDGRFATLEEVIEHYSDGVQPSPNLGLPFGMVRGVVPQLEMTAQEKRGLRAFLRTLTDEPMLSDPKFADPFVRTE